MLMALVGRPVWTGVLQGGLSADDASLVAFHDTERMNWLTVLPFLKTNTSTFNLLCQIYTVHLLHLYSVICMVVLLVPCRNCVMTWKNCLFRRWSKKTSKLRVTGLCVGNSPVTDEFPSQIASNAENVSIWWRHHVMRDGISEYLNRLSSCSSGENVVNKLN